MKDNANTNRERMIDGLGNSSQHICTELKLASEENSEKYKQN